MTMRVYLVLALICAPAVLAGTPPQADASPSGEDILFADLPPVEAASLHAQSLAQAPANVSVITAEDIRRYGYRTLGEALNSVRGFYTTNDHSYEYVGVRGLGLPGDFNTRFLVMLNGHALTDNIYNSNNYFEQDFSVDMELVERIEIIRGPTSALYGSNGILATINVVTRSPADTRSVGASAETSSFGERKLSLTSSRYLGHGANLLVEGSVFDDRGIAEPVEGLALPSGVVSPMANADGEHGYHTFANLLWRGWSFTANFAFRDKEVPIGLGTSLSGDPAQHVVDRRDLVEASYKGAAGPGQLQWRIAYDQYGYHDLYDYPVGNKIDPVQDINHGDWLDSSLTYEFPAGRVGPLTLGASGSWDLRNLQYNVDNGITGNWISRPNRGLALFAQQEWDISRRWKLYGGVRWDDTRYYRDFVSPRLAAVFQASPRTVYKLVYGRPFRNPSSFEQFYNDGGLSYLAAPALKPESAEAWEASVERRVARSWTLIVNAFHYRIQNVIEAVTLADGVQQYQNVGRLLSSGAEMELSGKLWHRLETTASTAWQSAQDGHGGGGRLPNAPVNISKMRVGLPLGRLFLSAGANYLSPRRTWSGDALGGFAVVDGTATLRLRGSFDFQAGIRNAFDKRYEDPIYLATDRLPGDGRSAFLRLVWHPWE